MNILNLPNFFVQSVEDHGADYEVFANYLPEPDLCPQCGVINPSLYKHGGKTQRIFDIPTHGKRCQIVLFRRRYRCRECQATFLQVIPEVLEYQRMTRRLIEWIERESLRRPFREIARDTGQHEKTIRLVFQAYAARLDEQHVVRAPEWLGIDEVKVCGKLACVLANLKERTLLDMLPERSQVYVSTYLTRLRDRRDIRLVTMDMWRPYRDAVRAVLPQAVIVVDKFHVLRMANFSMHRVRMRVKTETAKQKTRLKKERYLLDKARDKLTPQEMLLLDHWLDNFPDLKTAYDAKNAFYSFYEAPSREEAQQQLDLWRSGLPPDIAPEFKDLQTALGNWTEEILNYFDHRATNAYVEALNGLIKIDNRAGRGYSFEALRAKKLYGSGERRNEKPYGHGWRERRLVRKIIPRLMPREVETLDSRPPFDQTVSDGVPWDQAFAPTIPHEDESDDDSVSTHFSE